MVVDGIHIAIPNRVTCIVNGHGAFTLILDSGPMCTLPTPSLVPAECPRSHCMQYDQYPRTSLSKHMMIRQSQFVRR